MASLADLFNPSTFIILGIVALFIALVVVYFESKMREQNHKIASMLSLVSTLAEDMNGVKMGLNHLAMTNVGQPENTPFPPQNLGNQQPPQNQLNLIEVSDDESEEDNTEEEIMDESDLEDIEDDEDDEEIYDETTDDEQSEEPVKVVKISISDDDEKDSNSYEEATNLDFEPDDELAVLEDMDEIPQISEGYAEELLSLTYDEVKEENPLAEDHSVVPSASDLKTISINLGDESHSEQIDYKKLQLPKLRSIAVEKGLATSSEVQKLKKPELLKLLGVE
jgi:hypothetical protein